MTRSEAIQDAITYFDTEAGFAKEDAELMERCGLFDKLAVFVAKHKRADEFFNNTIKSILLAEQKRSEGCAFCRNKENEHGFFIDGNVLFYEDGKLGTEGIIITTCPNCGRDLTEGESV